MLSAQDVEAGRDSLRVGRYQAAISILLKVPATDTQWVEVQRDLAHAYNAIGRYDDSEAALRHAVVAKGGDQLWNTLGETVLLRGRRAAAESAFVRAMAVHASDSLTAHSSISRFCTMTPEIVQAR